MVRTASAWPRSSISIRRLPPSIRLRNLMNEFTFITPRDRVSSISCVYGMWYDPWRRRIPRYSKRRSMTWRAASLNPGWPFARGLRFLQPAYRGSFQGSEGRSHQSGKKRSARRSHLAYIQAHLRFAADARRDRPGYGERAPWARGHLDNDALRPYQTMKPRSWRFPKQPVVTNQ